MFVMHGTSCGTSVVRGSPIMTLELKFVESNMGRLNSIRCDKITDNSRREEVNDSTV